LKHRLVFAYIEGVPLITLLTVTGKRYCNGRMVVRHNPITGREDDEYYVPSL
jgi:hypothetical protein